MTSVVSEATRLRILVATVSTITCAHHTNRSSQFGNSGAVYVFPELWSPAYPGSGCQDY